MHIAYFKKENKMKTMIAIKMKPKKSAKAMTDEADMGILDELMGNCEKKMGSKFAKPKDEVEIGENVNSSPEEEDDESMDDTKMEQLLSMYKMLQAKGK
jgi:hypothetical protein